MILPCRVAAGLLCLSLVSPEALGQEAPPPPPETTTTPAAATASPAAARPIARAEIHQAIDGLSALTEPDNGTRAPAIKLYEEALAEIQRAEEATAREATFRREAADAAPLLETIRAELEKPSVPPEVQPPADATLQTLEQQLAQANAELAAARAKAEELQAEATRRNERRTQIPDELAKVRAELAEAGTALTAPPDENAAPDVAAARQALLRATAASASARARALEAELANYDARRDLLPARRDRALRRVADSEKLVTAWQTLTDERRALKAKDDAEQAAAQRLAALRQHPVLKDFATETESLTRLRTGELGLVERIKETTARSTAARTEVATLRQQFQQIRRRIDASGLNRATGLLLRRQYEDLTPTTRLERQLRRVVRDLEEADYNLIERDEKRTGAGDIDGVVQQMMEEIDRSGTAENRPELETAARELAVARRDLLNELIADSRAYRDGLVDLDQSTRELLAATSAYNTFVEARILWVRSFALDRGVRIEDIEGTLRWLAHPAVPLELAGRDRDAGRRTWAEAWASTLADVRERWASVVLAGLGLLVAFIAGRWARSRIRQLAELVAKYKTDSFGHTVEALIFSAVTAAPMPLFLWWLAWMISRVPGQVDVALAAAAGLKSAAIYLVALSFARRCFLAKGVVAAHFRWAEEAIDPVRRNLRWFIPTLVPVVIIVAGIDAQADEAANASVGRLAFSVGLLALTVVLHRLLRPSSPTMSEYLRRHRGGWIDRLRYVGYPIAVGLPIALIIATWTGYYYTSLQIQGSLASTLALAFGLIMLNGMLLRWLFVARRQVALDDARRRREEAKAEAEAAATTGDRPTETPPLDVSKLDLPAISGQTRQLFRTAIFVTAIVGLFAIWAEKLPALQMLDRLQIWPQIAMLEPEDAESFRALENGAAAVSATSTPAPAAADAPASPSGAAAPRTAPTPPGTSGYPGTLGAPGAPGAPGLSGDTTAATESGPPDDRLSVTVADLGLAALIVFLTWVAFRNVPGVVDITVLQRLPLDSGSRYALSTVLRYSIAIIGTGAACGAVGISWSRVQWLAAALTFGLAFGLQEIFANFVSGLIILAERPFKVGDTVTVGTVSGTVSRIRMRATTVTDWDRKELVIPNKTFITGEVINWTLTDPVLRVRVPVGVAYASDIDRVEALLLEVANDTEVVLEDPRPQALFVGFGDSTLNFELRVFIPNIDYFVSVRHTLHRGITRAFRAEGIEIAFPQRDLHLRSIGDLRKLVDRPQDLAGKEEPAWTEPE